MKTPEELNALKEEIETVSKKPRKLTDEELEQVSGGSDALNALDGLYLADVIDSRPGAVVESIEKAVDEALKTW